MITAAHPGPAIGCADPAFPAFAAWRTGRGLSTHQLGRLLERAGFTGDGRAAVVRVETHGQTPSVTFLAALAIVAGRPVARLNAELFPESQSAL